jgi:mannose-1-phosphate guanylyltransferase
MRAMLLAAGLGTRLRPITDRQPKCMVPVAGKSALQRNIEWLRSYGITQFVINLHYYPDMVTDYFGDGSGFGVSIQYSYEPALLGTAGALWAARRFFPKERFLVLYADNLIDCNINSFYNLHLCAGATLSMALFWRQDVSASGVVKVDEAGKIIAFKEKPLPGEILSNWVNAGLLLCEPKVMEFIPPAQSSDFGYDVLPALLAAGEKLQGYLMQPEETLYWIDRLEDLARTEAIFQKEGL